MHQIDRDDRLGHARLAFDAADIQPLPAADFGKTLFTPIGAMMQGRRV